MITKEAKNTPATTANPLSLPRQALCEAKRRFSGASLTLLRQRSTIPTLGTT